MKEGRIDLLRRVGTHSPSPEDDMILDEDGNHIEPDYQEIDDNHESKYEPKRAAPPQVRIERKVFQSAKMYASMSSTNDSEDILDAETYDDDDDDDNEADVEFDPTITSSTGNIVEELSDSPVTLTPKDPPQQLTPFDPKPPPNTPAFSFSSVATSEAGASGSVEMYSQPNKPDKIKEPTPPKSVGYELPVLSRTDGYDVPMMTKTDLVVKRRAHSPGRGNIQDRKMDVEDGEEIDVRDRRKRSSTPRPKPPTPPMRRLPSWVSFIF